MEQRLLKILFVVAMTVVGYVFIENVLNMEVEPFYLFLLFILTASAVGLYDKYQ